MIAPSDACNRGREKATIVTNVLFVLTASRKVHKNQNGIHLANSGVLKDAFRMLYCDDNQGATKFQGCPLASAMSTYYSYFQYRAYVDNEIGSLAPISTK